MIDVVIRARNESHWLPQLLKSLTRQVKVNIRSVLIVDHQSEDDPAGLIKLFPDLDISVVAYDDVYRPGKMLNLGVRHLFENVDWQRADCVLIVSAHCFITSSDSLSHLLAKLGARGDRIRAAFGRQVPMAQSDSTAVRDLSLLYPAEDRESSKAASFNNAFSLIRYGALAEHLFDEGVTNLEDVLWAAEEIATGRAVAYAAESTVAHHHGPHHGNEPRRLLSTQQTIEKHREVFGYTPAEADVDPSEVSPIFVTEGQNISLLEKLAERANLRKVFIWTGNSEKVSGLVNKLGLRHSANLVVIHRDLNRAPVAEHALYQSLPILLDQLVDTGANGNYFLVHDDSYEAEFPLLTVQQAATALQHLYLPALWPVSEARDLTFFATGEGVFQPTQSESSSGQWDKVQSYRALRGNGLVLTRAAMLRPNLAFEEFGFIDLAELS